MNTDKAPSRSHEYREHERQQLLARLAAKVETIKKIRELMNGMTLEQSEHDVQKKLQTLYDEVKKQYPAKVDAVRRLMELEHIDLQLEYELEELEKTHGKEKIDAITKEIEAHGKEHMKIRDLEVVTRVRDIHEEREVNRYEAEELMKDDDIYFMNSLVNGMQQITSRFTVIKEQRENRRTVVESVARHLGLDATKIPELDRAITDIDCKPICINVSINPEYYEQSVNKDTAGLHFVGTTINLIKDVPDQLEYHETVNHEEIHAFVDGFLPPDAGDKNYKTEFWVDTLKARVEALNGMMEQGIPVDGEALLSREIPYFGNLAAFIDSLHEEMVADLDRIHTLNPYANIDEKAFGEELLKTFTTARKRTWNVLLALQQLEKESASHPDLKKSIKTLYREILSRLQKATYLMSHELTIASMTGKRTDIEALLVLLKPSQYHHLRRYLQHVLGKEKYEKTDAMLRETFSRKSVAA
ncbi:MAG: hypothetical protein U0519_00995 [Candidatus Gracilibacteria bacterium]